MNTDDAAWRQSNPRFGIAKLYRSIGLHLFATHPQNPNKVLVVKQAPLEIVECEEGGYWSDPPFMMLSHEQARSLFDALWFDAGFRPEKNEVGSELNATRKHLADMRALAFARIPLIPKGTHEIMPK